MTELRDPPLSPALESTDDAASNTSPIAAEPAGGGRQHPDTKGRHPSRARHRRRQQPVPRYLAYLCGRVEPSAVERAARKRLLAASTLGVGCLLVSHAVQPGPGSLFVMPSDPVSWLALVCGIVGVWLVPGLWLCTLVVRTGAGPAAWLGARIATTLAWYALVGPAIHFLGEGAQVTAGGILIATVAATVAVCVGAALGFSPWPVIRWQRVLAPLIIGGLCAQAAIWAWTETWNLGMNYSHIWRLDWLIVLGCAVLTTIGAVSRPKSTRMFTAANRAKIVASVAVLIATVLAVAATGTQWSPAQRMPSAFSVEQSSAPFGYDMAFALNAIGPEGPQLVRDAEFRAADSAGRPVSADIGLDVLDGGERATLLVKLNDASRPTLCEGHTVGAYATGAPVRLTVRDQLTGVLVQGVVPPEWCVR